MNLFNTGYQEKTKITSSKDVEEEGYALDARQNNPDIEGTLAHDLHKIAETVGNVLLPYGGEMPDNADFNDYKTRGWYVNGGTNKGQINVPYNPDNGILLVFSFVSDTVRQIWVGLYEMAFMTRTYDNGTWSGWKSFKLE